MEIENLNRNKTLNFFISEQLAEPGIPGEPEILQITGIGKNRTLNRENQLNPKFLSGKTLNGLKITTHGPSKTTSIYKLEDASHKFSKYVIQMTQCSATTYIYQNVYNDVMLIISSQAGWRYNKQVSLLLICRKTHVPWHHFEASDLWHLSFTWLTNNCAVRCV